MSELAVFQHFMFMPNFIFAKQGLKSNFGSVKTCVHCKYKLKRGEFLVGWSFNRGATKQSNRAIKTWIIITHQRMSRNFHIFIKRLLVGLL